jgi:ribosomal protein L16/L10AE
MEALRIARYKLPIKTRILIREENKIWVYPNIKMFFL